MKRALVLAAAIAALTAAPAPAATEILQFAEQPTQSAAAKRDGLRLVAGLHRLGVEARGFEALPMVAVTGTPAQLRRARRLPQVLHHSVPRRRLELHLDRSVPVIFRGPAAPIRAAAGDARGERVAVLDTGINGLHPALTDRVVRNVEFVSEIGTTGGGGRPEPLPIPRVSRAIECPQACNTDADGHGTHVAGIIASEAAPSGRHFGVAPGVELVGLSISNTGMGGEFAVLSGIDYLLAHPELGVTAVNNSWGLPTYRWEVGDPINQATKMLAGAGITPVFSAGNDGRGIPAAGQPRGSSDCSPRTAADSGAQNACAISFHGAAPWTISVAAGERIETDNMRPETQDLAPFSSRGDPRPQTVDGIPLDFTPTLTAPGTFIYSTGNQAYALATENRALLVEAKSGTSMSAPHVTGAVALLQSAARARLGRRLTPVEVKRVLADGAAPMTNLFKDLPQCSTDPVSGVCEPDACTETTPGCVDTTPALPYERWQVGAGFLDVQGSLREIDEMAAPAAAPAPAPAAPAAPAPAAAAPAPAAAAPNAPAARKPASAKAKKRKAVKRKAKRRAVKKKRAKRRR